MAIRQVKMLQIPGKVFFEHWRADTSALIREVFVKVEIDRKSYSFSALIFKSFPNSDKNGYERFCGRSKFKNPKGLWIQMDFAGLCHPGKQEGFLLLSEELISEILCRK